MCLLSRCPGYTGRHALSPSRGLGSTRSLDWTSEYLLVLLRLVTFHCHHNALKWFRERIDYVGSRPRESDSYAFLFPLQWNTSPFPCKAWVWLPCTSGLPPKNHFQMSEWCWLALAIHCAATGRHQLSLSHSELNACTYFERSTNMTGEIQLYLLGLGA